MTPRRQIEAIDLDGPRDELRRQIATSNHTRLPVYAGSLDNIVGILHVRKVLNLATEEIDAREPRGSCASPTSSPWARRCSRSCSNFQEKQSASAWWSTSTAS